MKTLATLIGVLWVGLGLALFPKSSESQTSSDTDNPSLALASTAGQQSLTAEAGTESQPDIPTEPAPAAGAPATTGIPGIVSLKENGMSDTVVLNFAKNTTYSSTLNAGDILYLKEMRINDEIISAAVETASRQFSGSVPSAMDMEPRTVPAAQTPVDDGNPSQTLPEAGTEKDPELGFFPVEPPQGTPDYQPQTAQGPGNNYSIQNNSVNSSSTYYFQGQPESSATVMATPDAQGVPEQPVYSDAERVEVWREDLSPHGEWIHTQELGWCWRPSVVVSDPAWRPYYNSGRWIYTDHGWYWKSGYAWGHIAFHYGRWWRHARFGWMWYPDVVWAPSWVSFRRWDTYCGWAPLPPLAVYHPGAGFFYHGRSVSAGFSFGLGSNDFLFVSFNNFCDPYFHRHLIRGPRFYHAFHNSTIINNYNINVDNSTVINNGIPVEDVEKVSGTTLERVAVRKAAEPLDEKKRDAIDRSGKVPTIYREDMGANFARASMSGLPSSRSSLAGSPSPIPQTSRRGGQVLSTSGVSSVSNNGQASGSMPGIPGAGNTSAARLSTSGVINSPRTDSGSKAAIQQRGGTGSQLSSGRSQNPVLGTQGITIRGNSSASDNSGKNISSRGNPSVSSQGNPSSSRMSVPSNVWTPSRSGNDFSNSRSRWDNGNLTPRLPSSSSSRSQARSTPTPRQGPIIVNDVQSSPASRNVSTPQIRPPSAPRVPSVRTPSVSSRPSSSPITPSVSSRPSPAPSPRSTPTPSVRSRPSAPPAARSSGPLTPSVRSSSSSSRSSGPLVPSVRSSPSPRP